MFGNVQVVPIVLLNVAPMSTPPGSRSLPCRALARAAEYQVLERGVPVKSRNTLVGPAEPRTAEVALQDNGSNVAPTRIGTALEMSPPQMSAACWKAMSRCWPRVVPVFPPTGATGVGSLNPSPGLSLLITVMTAASTAGAITAPILHSAQAIRKMLSQFLWNTIVGFSPYDGSSLLLVIGARGLVDMLNRDLPVGIRDGEQRALEAPLEVDGDTAARLGALDLYQALIGCAQGVLHLRGQLQRDGIGSRPR